jgi:hypothetical protein
MKTGMILTLWALFSAGGLRADIATQSLNYQGQLTDLSDVAQTGNANLAFELYDAPVGGNLLWNQVATSVPLTRGLFNVDLDLSTGGLSRTVATMNGSMYLQVTANGQLLSPRKPILASMFALNSDRLQGYAAGNGPNMVPILDGTGRLNPSTVSAPFPLAVSGTGGPNTDAVSVYNIDPSAGEVGLRASAAAAAVSASASVAGGAGVLGYAALPDNAASTGVWGLATTGVGVRAWASDAATTALQASNTAGLGVYGYGVYGAQFNASTLGLRIGGTGLAGQSSATPATGIEVNSTLQGIVINNNGANAGLSSLASGTGVAVEGIAQSLSGIGVHGQDAGSGFGTGVWGQTGAAGGTAIRAENDSLTGTGPGLKATVVSPGGVAVDAEAPNEGVRALASGLNGVTYGIRSEADSGDGQALHGDAGGAGAAYGVYGSAPSSASGAGVYGFSANQGLWGVSTGSGATNFGVYGQAPLIAVRGESDLGSGSGIGVLGTTASSGGSGVIGQALSGAGGSAFGVQGLAPAPGGTGVYGSGQARGVAGQSQGANGHGLEGDAGPAGAGDGRAGVYATAVAGTGELVYGVYASVSGSSASSYGVRSQAFVNQGKAALLVNYAAQASDAGYALDVEGKLRLGTDNAMYYIGSSTPQTRWTVNCQYCGVGALVLVTPQMDITAGGTVNNSFWVGPGDVGDGFFVMNTAAPVANLRFQYLVIDK